MLNFIQIIYFYIDIKLFSLYAIIEWKVNNMDIMALIDKYIEAAVKKKKLEKMVKSSTLFEEYEKFEENTLFSANKLGIEKENNHHPKYYKETKRNIKSELNQVIYLLKHTYQSYLQTVEKMNQVEIKEATIQLSVKVDEIQKELSLLEKKSSSNLPKKDKNSSDCCLEIEKLTSSLRYYQSFISDLTKRVAKN